MHLRGKEHPGRGFTRIELIVAGLVLVLLLGVLLPQMIRTKRSTQLSACVENLKQIVFAHILWEHDYNSARFPGEVSTNKGGTLEYLKRGELFEHFRALTNGLSFKPTVLVCPSDNRKPAKSFRTLGNSNLSYFVNMDLTDGLGPGDSRKSPALELGLEIGM